MMLGGDELSTSGRELDRIYARRFANMDAYRAALWSVLVDEFFQALVPPNARILDLGCGYAQFINAIRAGTKYAMDLNPRARELAGPDVSFFLRDCSERWPLADNSLDIVFTSNFFEHLPDKNTLQRTMNEAARCLTPGGKIICLGPNIRYVGGAYWDFWDHHIPLSERTMTELLLLTGFKVHRCLPRFLPYTIAAGAGTPPLALVRAYLHMPFVWPMFGKQFLVVGRMP
jgi:SAM-dependent methyltransferase